MVFVVPDSRKSESDNRFEFTVHGATYTVPLLKYLPVSAAAAFERGDNVEGILGGCDNDDAREAVLAFDGEQFEAFLAAWSEASGVSTGESSASQPQSASTARRSNTTVSVVG
jgi:hypothetical protein